MSIERNIATVTEIYDRFSRGEINAILANLAEDVVWREFSHPDVPYAKVWRGRAAVREFFGELSKIDVDKFDAREYLAHDDKVVAIGSWGGRVRETGKRFDSEWTMVWSFGTDGLVRSFFSYEDMTAVAEAFKK